MQNDKIYTLLTGEILLETLLIMSLALENSCGESKAIFTNILKFISLLAIKRKSNELKP